jgi:Rieske Fe-S protein
MEVSNVKRLGSGQNALCTHLGCSYAIDNDDMVVWFKYGRCIGEKGRKSEYGWRG